MSDVDENPRCLLCERQDVLRQTHSKEHKLRLEWGSYQILLFVLADYWPNYKDVQVTNIPTTGNHWIVAYINSQPQVTDFTLYSHKNGFCSRAKSVGERQILSPEVFPCIAGSCCPKLDNCLHQFWNQMWPWLWNRGMLHAHAVKKHVSQKVFSS